MVLLQHPTIHDPKASKVSIGSAAPRALSSSATFFPRWNTQTPLSSPGKDPPQAAKTRSFQAHVAVIVAGVCGLVKKIKLRPCRKSYVCKQRPTDVVIWNVVFPTATEVKGTRVGDTSPKVLEDQSVIRNLRSRGGLDLREMAKKFLAPDVGDSAGSLLVERVSAALQQAA
jgi:hypothetical protein